MRDRDERICTLENALTNTLSILSVIGYDDKITKEGKEALARSQYVYLTKVKNNA